MYAVCFISDISRAVGGGQRADLHHVFGPEHVCRCRPASGIKKVTAVKNDHSRLRNYKPMRVPRSMGRWGDSVGGPGIPAGTAAQRTRDAAGTRRKRIRSMRMTWRTLWEQTQKASGMVVVDPSAASFIAELRSRGVYVNPPITRWWMGSVWSDPAWRRGIRINRDNCKGRDRRCGPMSGMIRRQNGERKSRSSRKTMDRMH